ncbi:MAG TPA: putative inorganic carbon transporter subunit DabA, partial [Myxococcota bacterium]|nr:putative inorganic carbon transporter subunit DabA [Myxococcota bacterium]
TVDNDVFGSGSKVLHNVVGRHGVILGNNSDLRPGLPWQSVHDGERFVHEPMRLQAIIEAPLDRISRILGANEDLEALIENEWAHLIAVEPGTDRFHRWQRGSFQEI